MPATRPGRQAKKAAHTIRGRRWRRGRAVVAISVLVEEIGLQRRTQDAKETYRGFDAKKKKNMWAIYAQKEKKFQFSFSTERRIRIPRLV